MGVGTPRDFLLAVRLGVDMFDCVMPTRAARNAAVYTPQGRVSIRRAEFTRDQRPVDEQCDCYTCRTFSRAYLRHLFISKEILGAVLATIHNIRFFTRFMAAIRESIEEDRFEAFYARNQALLVAGADQSDEGASDV
jgi:queuine tRNA-ribosyltransferase